MADLYGAMFRNVLYPGWELYIDGEPAKIYRVNRLMRGALVEAGLSPLQALRAATSNAAAILRKDIGAVAPGKLADLVLLDGNPLERIENTNRIRAVVVAGKLLRRSDLDRLLRLGEEMASRN